MLQLLVKYIVSIYYPCWFTIKSKFSWVEEPRRILYQLKLLKSQKNAVADIVLSKIQRSSWLKWCFKHFYAWNMKKKGKQGSWR